MISKDGAKYDAHAKYDITANCYEIRLVDMWPTSGDHDEFLKGVARSRRFMFDSKSFIISFRTDRNSAKNDWRR